MPEGRTPGRLRWLTPTALALLVPSVVYVLVSLGGITTSNIGAAPLRQDPSHPHGVEFGTPREVRSDEFMTDSPIALGWITSGGKDISNPLNVPPNIFQQLPSGPISTIVFFDGTVARLGPWLPDAMLFAGKWWLPTLLLLLGLPAWFWYVTGSRRWGYLACALILFSPSNVWWSGWPVNTLGFISASMALLLFAHDRFATGRRAPAFGAMLVSAVLMARYPTYYQPYAIVLGFPLLVGTVVFLVRREGALRPKLLTLGVTGAIGAFLTAGTMLESLTSIRVGLGTVYPGQRTSTGTSQPFGKVFGATDLGTLTHTQVGLVNNNASEISSAFTALLLLAVVLWAARRWHGSPASAWAWAGITAFAAFWLAWCTIDFGSLGEHLPVANLVPAVRAANVAGFLAILSFCIAMSQWRPGEAARRTAPVAAAIAGGVSLYAGSSLRAMGMSLLTVHTVWFSSLVFAAIVFALVRWPHRGLPLMAAALGAIAVTVAVNPVEVGLADLRGSATAHTMIEAGKLARERGELWASDTPQFDALMFATATPALSSRQQLGPNKNEWLKLDTDGSHENLWNRGGTYIRFEWVDQPGITWDLPTTDQLIMKASPCTIAAAEPRLKHIVSVKPLTLPCLRPDRRIKWAGLPQYVYSVSS